MRIQGKVLNNSKPWLMEVSIFTAMTQVCKRKPAPAIIAEGSTTIMRLHEGAVTVHG